MAASIAFPHHVEARRARVAGAPFGLDARKVELADGEFAPRQGAALTNIASTKSRGRTAAEISFRIAKYSR
jgi:hypothetical protein